MAGFWTGCFGQTINTCPVVSPSQDNGRQAAGRTIRVESVGFWGLGFRVWGLGFRVWGLGFRV